MTSPVADHARLCFECGYDLRATPGERCPECGHAFDRTLGTPNTPWLRPRRFVVSFWKTVIAATLMPARIARDIEQPAALNTAFRFRRRLSLWLALAPILVIALLYFDDVRPGIPSESFLKSWSGKWIPRGRWSPHWSWYLEAVCVGVVLMMTWLSIHLALGVPSYFCQPRRLPDERQARAIALSYYAAAPLAWLTLAFLIALATEWFTQAHVAWYAWRMNPTFQGNWGPGPLTPSTASVSIDAFVLASTLLAVVATIRSTFTIVRRTTLSGPARPIAAVATTLLAWPVLFILFPIATVGALILIQIIAYSWTV